MPSTARASHKHQNECTRDEMLFIPAFTRHNLRSKAGDADADEVEFEGCSQRRPMAAPKRLFDDTEPEAAGAVESVKHAKFIRETRLDRHESTLRIVCGTYSITRFNVC